MRVGPGFRVIHVLVVSTQGLPRGPHEHAMIHVAQSLPDDSGEMWGEACGSTGVVCM
jgi:hypothetical protein